MYVVFQIFSASCLDPAHLKLITDHRPAEGIGKQPGQGGMQIVHSARLLTKHVLFPLAEGRVLLRKNPLSGALKKGEMGHLAGQVRCNLHGGGAGADNADTPAVQWDVVVPAGCVKHIACEVIQAIKVGIDGVVQHTGSGYDDIDHVQFLLAALEMPIAVLVASLRDLSVEFYEAFDVEFFCYCSKIGQYFCAGGETVAPFRIGLKGVAVHVRRHIAAQARIGIVAPGAAQTVSFFIDGEIRDAGILELDGSQNAGHSCPDDRNFWLARCTLLAAHKTIFLQ